MSKTVTAAMATHLAGHSHTRCNMLLLDLSDGTSIGITDHDKDIDFDIGDGSVTYSAGTGILTSNISLSCGLDADNYEVSGPIGDTVSLTDILSGRFNNARARAFEVNWKNLAAGAIKLLAGDISEARVEGGKFVMEVRADTARYNASVGRVLSGECDADYADQIKCFATPTEVTGTITAVTDAMNFTVSYTGSYADNFFNKGTVRDWTGTIAGQAPVEIERWNDNGDGTATIQLFAPLVTAPAVDDSMTVRDGCGKSRGDCMAHNAIDWFRGYPEVPGRKVFIPQVPGT